MKTKIILILALFAWINIDLSLFNGNALMSAVQKGTAESVKEMINKDSDVDHLNASGTSPLLYSVKSNKQNIAITLIKVSKNINQTDRYGRSALHYAAINGNEYIFKMALDKGADITLRDKWGDTVFFHALEGRNKQIIERLIQSKDIDFSLSNDRGESAFNVAQRQGLNEVAQRIARGRN